jgi:hypothetical protein
VVKSRELESLIERLQKGPKDQWPKLISKVRMVLDEFVSCGWVIDETEDYFAFDAVVEEVLIVPEGLIQAYTAKGYTEERAEEAIK